MVRPYLPCVPPTVDNLLRLGSHILFPVFPVAITAIIAGFYSFFAEIIQNRIPQAPCGSAVTFHHLEPPHISLLYQLHILRVQVGEILLLQQEFIDNDILG